MTAEVSTDTAALLTRHHVDAAATSSAVYSPCERYRYLLTRTWDDALPRLMFIMLNPSKATEAYNDPTIERCERRARALGFGAVRIGNIFAWRETDPRLLRAAPAPVGPDNDALLTESLNQWLCTPRDQVICAWGVHGEHMRRGPLAERMLRTANRPLMALGLTKAGHPAHPLYIGYARQPFVWQATSP